jgi:hypothetical protein
MHLNWRVQLLFLFTLVLLTSSTSSGQGDRDCSVEGVVFDGDGHPLVEADVYALPGQDMLHPIWAKTDKEGRFIVHNLPPGRVYLHAYKESEDYPYDFFSFYIMPGERLPTVTVAPGATVKDIVIQLGAKAGHLKLKIEDVDGNPVEDAQLTFTRPDVPHFYGRNVPKDSMLVPPVPFRLRVEAKGYEPWHYGGKDWEGQAGLIKINSGEAFTVVVRMVRLGGN